MKENWKKDLEKIEYGLDKLEIEEEKKPETYFLVKVFIVLSCVLGVFLKPITLCWTLPMSIYLFHKIAGEKKISKVTRILSWILISPIVGGLLIKYKETNSVNEKSLVKVEQFRQLSPNNLFSFGEIWVVFSNTYLENANSYPDINIEKWTNLEFRECYYNLIEMQKEILPKPKKHLNISEGDLDFYYPCSEIFTAMKGKVSGDIVKIRGGDIFKILEVVNS